MTELEQRHRQGERYSEIVEREINAVLHTDEQIKREFGIDEEIFNKAEYTKAILGGIDGDEFASHCRQIGFATARFEPQWFLGQGLGHARPVVRDARRPSKGILRRVQPLSTGLFKYLRFVATK